MTLGGGNQNLHYTHPEEVEYLLLNLSIHAIYKQYFCLTPDLESLEVICKIKRHFLLLEETEPTLQLVKR